MKIIVEGRNLLIVPLIVWLPLAESVTKIFVAFELVTETFEKSELIEAVTLSPTAIKVGLAFAFVSLAKVCVLFS